VPVRKNTTGAAGQITGGLLSGLLSNCSERAFLTRFSSFLLLSAKGTRTRRPRWGARCSPLYDKGHPILWVFVHGRSFLEFLTPKVPLLTSPGDKKITWKKKSHKNHPEKRERALPFVLAHWRQKKKSGLSRRKLAMLGLQTPIIVNPFRPTCQRNITTLQPRCVLFYTGSFISDPGRSCTGLGTF
jgi:hypothetical protein